MIITQNLHFRQRESNIDPLERLIQLSAETQFLEKFGPTTALCAYIIGGKDKNKVGDEISGVPIIAKLTDGDRVCADRSASLCPTCVASGWAAKLKCEIPLTG